MGAAASARSSASTRWLAASSILRANSTVMALSPLGKRRGGGSDAAMTCVFAETLVLVTPLKGWSGTARCAAANPSHSEPVFSMSLPPNAIATLSRVTPATITTVLLKKGLRNVWMRGARPLHPGQKRLVGPAFTLRFVPAREDLATPEAWASPIATRTAIEAMSEGCIAVVDAMGISDAAIFGDILCARMVKRGVTALITDG